jgi:hypothetical protein
MAAAPYQAYKTMSLKRRRPDKQSAIRQTARTSPAGEMPDGGFALSGLQNHVTETA